ncbi:MAG: alpha-galactosidase [Eubacteriales bacterium]
MMLAKKPPMGWNSWNTFGEDINEELLMKTADIMVESGLKDAGYEYVVIDDCWSLKERVDGKIVADPKKFPHGMKYLADYIHSKGLKFGMYSCAGRWTCAGYPASLDQEFIDAQTFADFDVDFLKYDFCHKPDDINGPMLYYRMSMALKATGKDILFSACNWGSDEVEKWIRSTGAHMYRSTGDINDNFNSIKGIFKSQINKIAYSGIGCWNDLDMLVVGMHGAGNVGNGGCTHDEYLTHFALWSLFMSPLMIGCDIRNMDDDTKSILMNKDLIAINQDEEARTPFVVGNYEGDRLVFFRHLSNNEYCLAYVNFTDYKEKLYALFCDCGLAENSGYAFELYDIFDHKSVGKFTEGYGCTVPAHGCRFFKVKVVKD